MSKRILMTSTDLMMIQFLVPHVINLSENGYEVEVACSDVGGRMAEVRGKLEGIAKQIHVVRLHRSPVSPDNLNGYNDMKRIIAANRYDIIWTNEPVMGVATRLAAGKARKSGTKVLYMAHGFHFFDGAPKQNWMLYYPIEKKMTAKTDVLVTVNHEDHERAKTMTKGRVEYIHGIGINTSRLTPGENMNDIRGELGLSADDFIVLSVGELNQNKNQITIIKAIAKLRDTHIHYLLCGKGDKREELERAVSELGLDAQIHFLGYRKDVVDICSQSDVYVMPSFREGLPVSSLEAMYCGLPLVTSDIRGLVDVMEDGVSGYMCRPSDVDGFAAGIAKLKNDPDACRRMGERNRETVRPYCISETKKEVLAIIDSI